MPTTVELHSRIKVFVEELATLTDEANASAAVLDYLRFAASFHQYSFHNTILIWQQRPKATHVAGFQTWKSLGRHVRKGEKGIAILAPIYVRARQDGSPQSEEDEDTSHVLRFRTVYVFDVSQTEGADLPALPVLTGETCEDGLYPASEAFALSSGIQIEIATLTDTTLGLSKGGKVILSDQLVGLDRFTVLVHELAHELLNHKSRHSDLDKKTREIEAETVAHVVCRHFDLSSNAPNYLALHGANGKEVSERLQYLVEVSQSLIRGIESRLNDPALVPAVNQ